MVRSTCPRRRKRTNDPAEHRPRKLRATLPHMSRVNLRGMTQPGAEKVPKAKLRALVGHGPARRCRDADRNGYCQVRAACEALGLADAAAADVRSFLCEVDVASDSRLAGTVGQSDQSGPLGPGFFCE